MVSSTSSLPHIGSIAPVLEISEVTNSPASLRVPPSRDDDLLGDAEPPTKRRRVQIVHRAPPDHCTEGAAALGS